MPPRSKVLRLPPEIRETVENRMSEGSRDGYPGIVEWLHKQGHEITEDNLRRHEAKLKKLKQHQPYVSKIRQELERAGIKPICNDPDLERLLMRLGSLYVQERFTLAQITGKLGL